MKALASLTALALTGLAGAPAEASLDGATYRIQVVTDDGLRQFEDCASFGTDGALRLARAPLAMAWSYEATSAAIAFQATTAGGRGTDNPFGFALHGRLLARGALIGGAINEYGVTFQLSGVADAACETTLSYYGAAESPYAVLASSGSMPEFLESLAARPIGSHWGPITYEPPPSPVIRSSDRPVETQPLQLPPTDALRSGPCTERPCGAESAMDTPGPWAQAVKLPPLQAVRTDPCDEHWCDPRPDPTGVGAEVRARDGGSLAGRSFDVRYDAGRAEAAVDCWSFGTDGRLRTASGLDQVWRPAASASTAFQTSGDTATGYFAVAFHGELLDATTLRIDGIERWTGATSSFVATGTASTCVVLPAATTSGVYASFTMK